jgi:DNA polymerase
MSLATVDTPARFLLDLKKLLALHRDFGIESYPSSPELEHFLNGPSPLASSASEVRVAIAGPKISPADRTSLPPQPRSNQTLADIRAELGDCRCCSLHETRKAIVFGAGAPKASLFIVGDLPSPNDEAAGLPFSGEAGELLAKMLKAIGLGLADVYLASIVKCRTADDVMPSPEQIKTCLPFLLRQIDAVSPTVICAMGELAAQTMLRSKTPLIRLRGNFHDCHGIPMMPTFHPAFLLKNQELKKATWIDLQLIQAKLGLVKRAS